MFGPQACQECRATASYRILPYLGRLGHGEVVGIRAINHFSLDLVDVQIPNVPVSMLKKPTCPVFCSFRARKFCFCPRESLSLPLCCRHGMASRAWTEYPQAGPLLKSARDWVVEFEEMSCIDGRLPPCGLDAGVFSNANG